MPWPEPVVSARSIVLDLPPSCIEFCPAHPSYFLVGTYNLIKDIPDTESRASQDKKDNDPEDSDTVSKKTQNRNGTILVFQLQDDEIKHVQTVDQPSALLDLHFQTVEGRNDICGVVSSTGYLSTFQLSPIASSPQPLQQVSTVRIPDVGEEVLFLSLAWHPTDPDLVAITTSTNDVYLLRLNPAHTTFVAGLQPIISHDLEAWTVSLSSPLLRINPETPANQADWFTLYSGGDDSTLRFTSCQVEKQNDGDAAAATPYAPVKVPGHTAGVTAILPMDVMFRDGSSLVITGSYDDHLRAYAIQPLHETYGMRKSKLLTEINLGGGVWRLKLIGTRSDTDGRWTARILASCMHAGARVVELSGGSEPACGIEVLARFEEHKSMNYGSDFHVDEASPGQLSFPLDVAVLRTRVVGGDGIRGFPDAERVVGYPFDQIDSQSLPGSATVESEPTASAIDLERTPKPHSAIAPLIKCRWDQFAPAIGDFASFHPSSPLPPLYPELLNSQRWSVEPLRESEFNFSLVQSPAKAPSPVTLFPPAPGTSLKSINMAPKQRERTYPLMSRRQVEGLIADGRKIVIINQFVVKVDAWVPYHPGGEKAIQHMVGRDATDEFQAFHSVESQRLAEKYRVGRIEGRWTNFVPPIQGGVFRPLPTASDELQEVLLERENNKKNITTASSAASSRAPSPTFDLPEPGVHQRKGGNVAQRASSASSVSSVEDFGEAKEPSMSFLDVKTMKEIKLDLERYPSLDDAVQDNIVRKYRELHRRLEAEGLFDCNYSSYAIECCRYFLFAAGAFVFLRLGWYVTSAVFLGCLWHQLSFTVHDAAHMGITHNFHIDWIIGIACADYIGGLSVGWWKRNHNVHHIITNDIEHDPDIQHMPFFAISHRFLHSLRSSYYERVMEYDAFAKLMLSIQHYSYYILLLFGRFNLIRLSWEYLILGLGPKRGIARHYRWVEIAGQFFFWYWFGYGLLYRSIDTNWHRFLYFLVASMVTMPLHLQITLSHFAMSTADLGPQESYPQKMLRTTMDVDCPQWLDFFHGGLQFQAIHHLYPRMPRHNLRRAQKLVQEFCDEVDIPYALFGFVDGNKQVIGRLADVARQGRILAECQKALTASGDPLHAH